MHEIKQVFISFLENTFFILAPTILCICVKSIQIKHHRLPKKLIGLHLVLDELRVHKASMSKIQGLFKDL